MKLAGFLAAMYLYCGLCVRSIACARLGLEQPAALTRWAVLAFSVVTYILVHEAGHRLAGALQGWRCIRFGFGPWEFVREWRGWRVERVKTLWGAFVRQVPPSFAGFRREKAITVSSGPLCSLCMGLAAGVMAYTSTSGVEFWLFASLAVFWPLGFFELIPFQFAAGQSDGASLLQMLRGGTGVDAMIREVLAETSNVTALRFREWPLDVMERLASTGDRYAFYVAYLYHMDRGDIESAGRAMTLLRTDANDADPAWYACESAWFAALHERDLTAARTWVARGTSCPEKEVVLRVKAAVAWAEGNLQEAERLAKAALAEHGEGPLSGSNEYERDRLNDLMRLITSANCARPARALA